MQKLLWVKFGWSDFYRGGPVDGNFGWLNKQRGRKNEGRGHEAFNFMPASDGMYYCYVPPQAGDYAPWKSDNTGWTVVCLAKRPKRKGIHVVGWYENATLIGDWEADHPAVKANLGEEWSYCITSPSAYFVPPEFRTEPFSDSSVRRGKYSFLAGPEVDADQNKTRVMKLLQKKVAGLAKVAVHNPDQQRAPDPEVEPGDPLSDFGTPEHRKKVEHAAERAVVEYYKAMGYRAKRVAQLPCGYDYVFTRGSVVHHVEVKGTSTSDGRFYLTRNEDGRRRDPRWRFGRVTDALTKHPKVTIFTNREFERTFDLAPYVYIGTPNIDAKGS